MIEANSPHQTTIHNASGSNLLHSVRRFLLILLGALTLTGCASTGSLSGDDPLEPMNRAMYAIHQPIERVIMRPTAKIYETVTPTVVRQIISNVFNNIGDLMSAVAGILQGKFDTAGDDLGRVIINTSFGLGGIIDFASDANIPRGNQDFGMVLAHYGVGPRPYLFIPFMGPTTLRDGTGAIAEAFASPTDYILPVRARNTMTGVGAVDAMSKGVKLLEMVDATALDKYTFIRNAYLQARAAKLGDNAYRKADTEEDVDSYFDEGDEDLMNEEPGKTDKPAATTDAVPQAVTPATHGEPELTPQPTPQTAHEPAASPEPTSEVPTSATP